MCVCVCVCVCVYVYLCMYVCMCNKNILKCDLTYPVNHQKVIFEKNDADSSGHGFLTADKEKMT